MGKREEVSQFLKDFITKSKIWDILFRSDRTNNKNTLTLLELEITYTEAKKILLELQLGRPNSQTICISFHFSEHKLVYPFKIGSYE